MCWLIFTANRKEKNVPKEFRFEYFSQQLTKEDNSEEYQTEINRCYKQ